MMQLYYDVLSFPVTAAGLFDDGALVSFAGVQVLADDAPVAGIAMHPATEVGMSVTTMGLGLATLTASGVVSAGNRVVSAVSGGVKAAGADPANVLGFALTSAADGAGVRVLFMPR
ncbi:MAG: hypothetical protein CMO30_06475 [Tistrella sp.]|uniref:DUF2190 domain-containing protein n=1 Tax=Tistrella mobilis TaxID=171437 RepID=A0A3B9II96_9PROT|nr:capsid cement protein [Tistrella sp.]MAD39568.1 hypothetical protein [Tistrella sp.]MBA74913.1 hypothetical protein [Tistrella sp.]HAE47582.1 hypothetical protein [Tistrella mobilis]|tara:strand:+ start:221 stop:568 length:348 start_codon:yes stop_codon:yes gene_type:complete